MDKLSINLKNCYGIGSLNHEFDFSSSNSFLIYASNGTMKTSLAQTFRYFGEEGSEPPSDRVYPERESIYELKIDNTNLESKNRVLVISPDDKEYDSSNKISNFLASKDLKKQYDAIYLELDSRQKAFITKLKKVSGSSDCDGEFLDAFKRDEKDTFLDLLNYIKPQLSEKNKLYNFRYNDVFDKKGNIKKFLDKHKTGLDQYIENYQTLIEKSDFFQSSEPNSFGTYQANQILKSIDDNAFFDAGHNFELRGSNKVESAEQLNDVIEGEVNKIVNDKKLKSVFDKVGKAIDANLELRNFKKVLEKDNLLLIELKDYEKLKKKVWLGFLSKILDEVEQLDEFYTSKKADLEIILKKASEEVDTWKKLVEQFNARFYVPFKVSLKNQEDVLLKEEQAVLDFEFFDGRDDPPVNQDKNSLLKILSKGEQRAHFILQLLFDIEARSLSTEKTVLVFDDIADSFDYKNKYAIIEYIKDLHKSQDKFGLIILTHNFDFYRTVTSRLHLNRAVSVLMAVKKENGDIELKRGEYIESVFSYFLKQANDKKTFISLIPFIRNLVEYTDEDNCDDYINLTKCLHIKEDSENINCNNISDIWKDRFNTNYLDGLVFGDEPIQEMIFDVASQIAREGASVDEIILQNKIVLSIAIRLKSEKFMINMIPELDLANLSPNQTALLFSKFKETNPPDEEVALLDKVILMTPENIHLNAFMYEPLIDMSVHHLVTLYSAILELG